LLQQIAWAFAGKVKLGAAPEKLQSVVKLISFPYAVPVKVVA
jgi:hypothetical protein